MNRDLLREEIERRRVLAIISHPDAGKTTITEKLLLFGNLIKIAGTIKSKKSDRHATSDWMTMEQERGISVTSSVMQFPYKDRVVNLLDTPGHEDFSEDTYRVLTADDGTRKGNICYVVCYAISLQGSGGESSRYSGA